MNRQDLIIQYMASHNIHEGYTTREIATMMDTTTNAILAAFKRLQKKERVFHFDGKWYVTGKEKIALETRAMHRAS